MALADDQGIKIIPINLLSHGSEWPPRGLLSLATTQYIPCEAGPERCAQQVHRELARRRAEPLIDPVIRCFSGRCLYPVVLISGPVL